MNISLFIINFSTGSREIIDIFPRLIKTLNVAFFSDNAEGRSFKLCIFIPTLGFHVFIVGLMTSTLFTGDRLVRNRKSKFSSLDSYTGT